MLDEISTGSGLGSLLGMRHALEPDHLAAVSTLVSREPSGYRAAQHATNTQVVKVRDTFGDRLPDPEAQALKQVEGLTSLRQSVEAAYLPADNIDPAYGWPS